MAQKTRRSLYYLENTRDRSALFRLGLAPYHPSNDGPKGHQHRQNGADDPICKRFRHL